MKQRRDRYEDQDDATLVASVMVGEREAFDILLQRYSSHSSDSHACENPYVLRPGFMQLLLTWHDQRCAVVMSFLYSSSTMMP